MTEKINNNNSQHGNTAELNGQHPVEFNFKDIGSINLKEAEEIANEDIFFITEKDLLDGLEDFNLIPLKDQEVPVKKNETRRPVEQERQKPLLTTETIPVKQQSMDSDGESAREAAVEEIPLINADQTIQEQAQPVIEQETPSILEVAEAVEETAQIGTEFDETEKWVPLERIFAEKEPQSEMSAIIFVDEFAANEMTENEQFAFLKRSKLYRAQANDLVFVDELAERNNELKVYEWERSRQTNKRAAYQYTGESVTPVQPAYKPEDHPPLEIDENDFTDDDLEFIDFSIVQDDYGLYINDIDSYHEKYEPSKGSSTVELLGLTSEELRFFEDILFNEEYKGVDFREAFDYFKTKRIMPFTLDKTCRYILHDSASLSSADKLSIEEDITSASALIYEEDVEVIKGLLKESTDDAGHEEVIENIFDITDRVVIIEDDLDVDRFVKEFPEEKQTDMKRLLTYFDGLFEKLPESTIRKFADSEYYELYIKVLHELGV